MDNVSSSARAFKMSACLNESLTLRRFSSMATTRYSICICHEHSAPPKQVSLTYLIAPPQGIPLFSFCAFPYRKQLLSSRSTKVSHTTCSITAHLDAPLPYMICVFLGLRPVERSTERAGKSKQSAISLTESIPRTSHLQKPHIFYSRPISPANPWCCGRTAK